MGNHIWIGFGPTLYFIPINRYRNFIRFSELAYMAWRGDGPSHSTFILSIQNFKLRKRMSAKTWLEQYPTGWINPYVVTTFRNLYSLGFGHKSSVCWVRMSSNKMIYFISVLKFQFFKTLLHVLMHVHICMLMQFFFKLYAKSWFKINSFMLFIYIYFLAIDSYIKLTSFSDSFVFSATPGLHAPHPRPPLFVPWYVPCRDRLSRCRRRVSWWRQSVPPAVKTSLTCRWRMSTGQVLLWPEHRPA